MKLNQAIFLAMATALVVGCAKKEEILKGQRFDVRVPLDQAVPAPDAKPGANGAGQGAQVPPVQPPVVNRRAPIRLPKAVNLSSWTHKNASPTHDVGNIALGRDLTRLWSVSIGSGNERRRRLTSDPVVAGGLIFTLDSANRVMATSPIGEAAWVRDLTPASDKPGDAFGGGLAYAKGVLYATSGFGSVTAMRADTGKVLWTQKLDAPVMAAPTVYKGRVFVVSRDNRAWAIKARNGRILWQQESPRADAGLLGGASPAIAGRSVILPFSSGEIISARMRNGLRIWSVAVSGARLGLARSNITDISSDPVVAGARVYAANQSGRITAVALKDGQRIWSANQGSYSPVLPIGNAVFLVSDESQLVRLDARDGSVVWAVDLPAYKKDRTRRDAYVHFGPLMAGGRLIVASSDGSLRSFDPVSGQLISTVDIPSGAASQPAIVDGVLYILSQNGDLNAYR